MRTSGNYKGVKFPYQVSGIVATYRGYNLELVTEEGYYLDGEKVVTYEIDEEYLELEKQAFFEQVDAALESNEEDE